MAHAWLLHGPAGIGKLHFATALAQALVCEAPQADGVACAACQACLWFAAGNHPDARVLRPEALEEEGEEAAEGASRGAKGKAPSKDIRIEQIRRLQDWV